MNVLSLKTLINNRVARNTTPDGWPFTSLSFELRSIRNISDLLRRVASGRRRMYWVTVVVLGAVAGVVLVVGVAQSWEICRQTRTEGVDLEIGKGIDAGRAEIAHNDKWIFGSVVTRLCTSSRLGPDAVTVCRGWPRPSPESMTLVQPKQGIGIQALTRPTGAEAKAKAKADAEAKANAESDAKAQADGRLEEYMSGLPSPPPVHLAQKINFQRASLVPVPLRPRRVQASTTSDKTCNSESVDFAIRPVAKGTYSLHPVPLRPHPIPGDVQNQPSEGAAAGIQNKHHSGTNSNIRSTRKSAGADACRPDSTTSGTDSLTRTHREENHHITDKLCRTILNFNIAKQAQNIGQRKTGSRKVDLPYFESCKLKNQYRTLGRRSKSRSAELLSDEVIDLKHM
ncbi:hypothetical protein PV08_06698 [Exophiala spinifera]|uniref:Uncharacterized protein n=1 Tax=Exophiala spinifera TaxID=91928 RepID=A0A0D1ZM54_9EURO|nr:uncharacterized protein PV08_06698 [Exophiala spinifera]KIW13917.1 hypothetical protein PV08_06698 [Exophiala spinifera]